MVSISNLPSKNRCRALLKEKVFVSSLSSLRFLCFIFIWHAIVIQPSSHALQVIQLNGPENGRVCFITRDITTSSKLEISAAENMVRKESHPDDILQVLPSLVQFLLFPLKCAKVYEPGWNLLAVLARDTAHNFHRVWRFSDYFLHCLVNLFTSALFL